MLGSAEFVEALGRLGYPDASSLKPSDFDWAFDTPETQGFLHFICRTLDKSNVITMEEARAFQELKNSGKAILDEAALSRALKTVDSSGERSEIEPDPSPSSSSMCDQEDDLSIEELEEELQALLKEKLLKERRCNKLQVFAIAGEDVGECLTAELERAESKLNEANASIEVENTDTNTLLESLTDHLSQLESHLTLEEEPVQVGEGEPKMVTPLLSQLSMDPFLEPEEFSKENLALLLQSPLDQDVSDPFETSSTELSQKDLASSEDQKNEQQSVDLKRTEMARIQWSYIMAEHQLIQATAEEEALRAGIELLSKYCPTKDLLNSSNQDTGEDALAKELLPVEVNLEEMLSDEDIPDLLRKSARLLSVPVISEDLEEQLAKYKDHASSLDQVLDCLQRHNMIMDVIVIGLKKELKKWTSFHSDLEKLCGQLVKQNEAASQRMESLAHLDLALDRNPNSFITSKDAAFSRLLHILENGSNRDQPNLLETFGALDKAAQDLANNLKSKRAAFEEYSQKQRDLEARLGNHFKALHQTLYAELQHLFLGPQAHPVATAGKRFIFPNAQELTAQLLQAESQLQSFQKMLQDILGEVEAKRSELERKRHLKQERELYVYFNLDPEKLEGIVEDVERKAKKEAQK